jgi:hypothetical protein
MRHKYKGELLKGHSHKEGGIPVRVGGQTMVEMEGGEGVVNKTAMASTSLFEFQGEKLTTCEIVSRLNQKKGDGVKFECESIEGRNYKFGKGGQVVKKNSNIFLPLSIGSMFEL